MERSSELIHAVGLGSEGTDFSFGVQYQFKKDQIEYELVTQEPGYEYLPLKNRITHLVVRVVKTNTYFIGTEVEVNQFVEYIKDEQFGDSAYAFDGNDICDNIYDNNILTFSPMDLLILGYHLECTYGDNIKVYCDKRRKDMFVHILNITPGSKHLVHFFNKSDHNLFADFMNRYSYVNWK